MSPVTTPHLGIYQLCLNQAVAACRPMMDALVETAQTGMRERLHSDDDAERPEIDKAVHLLATHKALLCERFGPQLLDVMSRPAVQAAQPFAELRFEDLELMDDNQVQENIELARIQQAAVLAVEGELAELDARLSTAQDLKTVQPDRNPLRPAVFGEALRLVLGQTSATPVTRQRWMHYVGGALGGQLRGLYAQLNEVLRQHQVHKAPYVIVPSSETRPEKGGAGAAAQPGQLFAQQAAPSITVEQLHSLLRGHLDVAAVREARSVRSADSPAPPQPGHYAHTMPAALEALAEMRQLDASVERMRGNGQNTQNGQNLGQVLGQEVVHWMMVSLTQNPRLLPPVRALIGAVEPALRQLALRDPRFFSDKAHPARVLLDRIAQRSMAFEAESDSGFDQMLAAARQGVELLSQTPIEDHVPFEAAVQVIERAWTEQDELLAKRRKQAVAALLAAEQRNLLASKIGQEVAARSEVRDAPAFVREFLVGPWAQVIALARSTQGDALSDGKGYGDVVDDLLWSCRIDEARKDRPRLMRMIPGMLASVRDGLASIDYLVPARDQFLSELMRLHQDTLKARPPVSSAPAAQASPPPPVSPLPLSARAKLDAQFAEAAATEPWLAPREAQDSGFMDSAEAAGSPADFPNTVPNVQDAPSQLPVLGQWMEFRVDERWVRARLTWASPQGTLFMFTDGGGKPYSMTRRSMERRHFQGLLRHVDQQDVVGGALDSVARAAMRNSVDVAL